MSFADRYRQWEKQATERIKRCYLAVRRPAACVLVAAMAVAALLFMLLGDDSLLLQEGLSWINVAAQMVLPLSLLALAVLAVIHIKKDVPRLLLLFAGASAFYSIRLLAVGWMPALLVLAAGLIAWVFETRRQNALIGDLPAVRVKSVMLTVAGVLALFYTVYQTYSTFASAMSMAAMGGDGTYQFFYGLGDIVTGACTAAFCFMKSRPASVFHRMFFIGMPAVRALQAPLWIIALLQYEGLPALTFVRFGAEGAAAIALTLLVIVHAVKTRRKAAAATEPETEDAETA